MATKPVSEASCSNSAPRAFEKPRETRLIHYLNMTNINSDDLFQQRLAFKKVYYHYKCICSEMIKLDLKFEHFHENTKTPSCLLSYRDKLEVRTIRFSQYWPQGYKTFSCSTQLSIKFILLMNVKMPTIVAVGILTFMCRINDWL